LLISIWVYAYSRGIGSAREISRLCEIDPAFQWLTGMNLINHHTLSDFRVDPRPDRSRESAAHHRPRDSAAGDAEATSLHKKANRSNLFIKIPGTKEGNPAIEEAIAAGVAINVTLLFSREQYLASADAYMLGLERRIAAGLSPTFDPSLRVPEPLGWRNNGQSPRPPARQAQHCHRTADV
jgi:hypothetical protein